MSLMDKIGGFFGISAGNDSSNRSTVGEDAKYDNNQAPISYGNQTIVDSKTAQKAVDQLAAVSSNSIAANTAVATNALTLTNEQSKRQATLSKSALESNNKAVRDALDFAGTTNKNAFDFGTNALDANKYTVDKTAELAEAVTKNSLNFGEHALDKTTGLLDDMLGKFSGFTTKALIASEDATKGALSFAKTLGRSESASQNELLIKVVGGIAVAGFLAFALNGGKK